MKNDWKWLAAFAAISILIVALLTNFSFNDITIQQHDSYDVFSSIQIIAYTTLGFYTSKNIYLLVDLMTSRYNILAILFSIVNPIIALFVVILVHENLQWFITFRELYPNANFATQLVPVYMLTGIFLTQAILEVKTLRKVWWIISK